MSQTRWPHVKPTSHQLRSIRAVTKWYLTVHYNTDDDPGLAHTFTNPARVGAFAVSRDALLKMDEAALFKLLITVSMFQRRQDLQILRILRSIEPNEAEELTSLAKLAALVEESPCSLMKSTEALHSECDLGKDPKTKLGCCQRAPAIDCHMKRHTVLLRRYGHFGKVPTSAAVVLKESGAASLPALLAQARASTKGREKRARAMVEALSRVWRVSEKIAAMFLSILTNPDLTPGVATPNDVDWRHFVVIDSNVDLFLKAISYRFTMTYEARRHFIRAASRRVNLNALRPELHRDNPRLVQQAMYLFMSETNRRALALDCMHKGPHSCNACTQEVARLCPVRHRDAAPLR